MAQFLAKLEELIGTINGYVSDYVLIILLVATGLFFTIKTRFVQVRCFGEGMKKVFGNLSLKGGKQHGGLSSFQALATAIAAQVGTGNIVGACGAILVGGPVLSSGCGSSPSSAWQPSTPKPFLLKRPVRSMKTATLSAARSTT